jgi:transposase
MMQASEKMVVALCEMGHKQDQQCQGRLMARGSPLLAEAQWNKDCALASQTAQALQGWQSVDRESLRAGRDSPDFAQRRSLARVSGEISTSYVLAAVARLGGAVRLVEHLASVPERIERAPAVAMERAVPGRQSSPAKKGARKSGTTKREKGTKWTVVVDGRGIPLGDHLCSVSPSEVKLAETTLAPIRVGRRHRAGRPRQKPQGVIADKGYDSDALRARLRRRGILLIAPHCPNRHRTPPRDGRVLRRYKWRWTVERSSARLGNFRRLVVRYDRSLSIYWAFFHNACFMIVLREVVQ